MLDLKPNVEECERHLDNKIFTVDGIKYCFECGKAILTVSDEHKIKRTHDEGT